jgi:glutamate dehydrogenase
MAPDAARRALESAVGAAAQVVDRAQRSQFEAFAGALLAGADARAVRTRGAATLAQVARQGFELLARRAPGEVKLRVHDPADRPGRTVVEVLQDDRPFLVDTVRLTLRRRALAEQLLLHPILAALRDAEGRLRSLAGGPAARRESFIYVEIFPRLETPEERAGFEAELRRALATVADVTDDYRRLADAVRELAANVEAAGRFIPDGAERAAKIRRFLEWLLADHFVLMGFRASDFAEAGGEREVRLRPGSACGATRPTAASSCPGAATRSPTRSTACCATRASS